MINLASLPTFPHTCPECTGSLETVDWYIPGMRNLAKVRCIHCKREYFIDLPSGHALLYPSVLDMQTGKAESLSFSTRTWFDVQLEQSYARRSDATLKVEEEKFRTVEKAAILNCLDGIYGHGLEKLLNIQHYLDHHQLDIIVIVPKFLRWLVPDGVAAIWTVHTSLGNSQAWNDGFAAFVKQHTAQFSECYLLSTLTELEPIDYQIERFTRIQPFPTDTWLDRLSKPTVTFIWREDRLWQNPLSSQFVIRLRKKLRIKQSTVLQKRKVIALATLLRTYFPTLDFAVAGIGKPGGLPNWITDLRTQGITEAVERTWSQRYADSHMVIGVHGSNMLLPSALAGSTIDLIPEDRWGNLAQDIIYSPNQTGREIMFRYQYFPITSSPSAVAIAAKKIITRAPEVFLRYQRKYNAHSDLQNDLFRLFKYQKDIHEKLKQYLHDV
ncbi:MAG: hypothetical protein OHK0046_14000 [Anaerolineae bacterium]